MSDERGSALVETAIVVGLLVLLALGAAEMAFAFRDSTIVSGSSREAARIGAALGDTPDADCVILQAAAGALHAIADDQVLMIDIFKSDTSGGHGVSNLYRPSVDTDTAGSLVCGTWFPLSLGWPEGARDNTGSTRDWLGVEVVYDHDWHTGFAIWSGSVCNRGAVLGDCWREQTIMHLEPASG